MEKEEGGRKKEKVNRKAQYESGIDLTDIVIIDNGTHTCKIGISGEDYPRLVINTLSGIPEIKNDSDSLVPKVRKLFGPALQQAFAEKKYTINLDCPISCSTIENLDDMEQMWKYIFTEVMQLDPSVLGVLYIDSPLNNKDYKAKIAQSFFENLKVNSLVFMNSSTLSLFSTGHTTGFVAEIGHGSTTTIPIFEGFPLPHAAQSSFIAGNEITKKWEQELKEKKIPISFENPMVEREIIKKIKEKMSLVAMDYDKVMSKPDVQSIQEKSYELPDGSIIQFPISSRVTPPEILFQPKLIGSNAMSITDMMLYSLQLCDYELQHQLANHFVLCGGGSLLNGLLPRIEKEMKMGHTRTSFNFILGTQRRYSAWIGGSMLGSLSAFQELAITKKEYEDNQYEKLIHKRTF